MAVDLLQKGAIGKDPDQPEDDGSVRLPAPRQTLRVGFSTGSAAAAAAQAALRELLGLSCPEAVEVRLPGGGSLTIPLLSHGCQGSRGEALVVKDAGDDPDATQGARIGARVWFSGGGSRETVNLRGGEGVGRVTKPGLPVAVGEPAINPVPRRMLHQAVAAVRRESGAVRLGSLEVEIFVPDGVEIARHTLNPRLGILGGISILGTTGLVRPFSHEAYRATIASALKVARAVGLTRVVLTTGGKSEEYLRGHLPHLPEESFVQMGDYVRFAIRAATGLGFTHLTVGAFFGKAVKMAQGFGHTHASRGLANFGELARWTHDITGDPDLAQAVVRANTAREILENLPPASLPAVIGEVGRRLLAALRQHAGPGLELAAVILNFDGAPLFWGGEGEGAQ
jgi:cobalt-precorrin-5B (C1)-methyltransferase|uniref:Cobalt-precorrin-5B C(1)-methyltransferase n=1 Tax=Desulfobacca acetoxidans TaxID=60893 RepID=A0A7C3UW85_9BACT